MATTTLYRCQTPTDWLCPCGRVARELRKRDIEARQVRVALRKRDRQEIEALTGQTRVPVLVLGRDVIVDSRRAVEHLEFRDSQPPSPPPPASPAAPPRAP